MPSIERLTDKAIRALKTPVKGNQIHYEKHPDSPKGFGIRVTSNGAKSFLLRYVALKEEHRYTIGPFPSIGTEAARREANRLMAQIILSDGKDHPMAKRREAIENQRAKAKEETFGQAVEDYVRREQVGRKGNATAAQVKQCLLSSCVAWRDRPLREIAGQEIFVFLEHIRDGDRCAHPPKKPHGYMANRVFSYLRTFFKWCASPGINKIDASPMLGMSKPWCGEKPRTRYFNDDELVAIWNAADQIGGSASAYIKLAMLTGKRRTALVRMKWKEIDKDGVWTPSLEARETKNKRLHAIPLPRFALEILSGIRPARRDIEEVFPGRTRGTLLHPGTTLQRKVRRFSGVDDFILHALRHTVETRTAGLGVPPHIRDLILDHAPARGAGAGYDHYHYTDEMRSALNTWGDYVKNLVEHIEDGVKPFAKKSNNERRSARFAATA